MSRCFPYPPPAYYVSPIESFKLQKEIELEKKDKKRHRKEKKRGKDHKKSDDAQHRHNKRKLEKKNLLEQKIDNCTMETYDQAELLEHSGLTEEHDLPCRVQNSESSESSHDSKRRKIVTSITSFACNGTKLCIKLSVPKPEDHESQSSVRMQNKASGPSRVVLKPPSLVRIKPKHSEPRNVLLFSQSSERVQKKVCIIDLEPQPLVRLEKTQSRALLKPKNEVLRPSRETCLDREADKTTCSTSGNVKRTDQFTNSSRNFNFPPKEFESCDAGDQQWLFGAPKQAACPAANCKVKNGDFMWSTTVSTGTSFQPRACYLPQFDMHQLPYVMPF